jgi:uncharacterized protein (DUF1778 family)
MPRVPNGSRVKMVAQTVRLTDDENERIKRAAKKQGWTANAFMVYVLNSAANDVLGTPKEREEFLNGKTTSKPSSK